VHLFGDPPFTRVAELCRARLVLAAGHPRGAAKGRLRSVRAARIVEADDAAVRERDVLERDAEVADLDPAPAGGQRLSGFT
jgi:hypothetical protein